MTTTNKNFVVKNGLVVEGATATVNSSNVVTESSTSTLTNKTLTSPTLTTPALGTPASGVMTNVTGLPLTTGVTGTLPVANGGTGVVTSTGSGNNVLSTSPTLVTPVLGTPTSATLTNATGLPVSGITSSTTTALGVGSIELGHASDTTIARSGAGVVTIEGVEVTTNSGTQTLTNKTLNAPIINLAINAQTGTTYTPVLSDNGKLVTLNNASAIALTVPTNVNVTYATGAQINLLQLGIGQVTVAGDVGVTVYATPGANFRAQYSGATLIKLDTNIWLLGGDLS